MPQCSHITLTHYLQLNIYLFPLSLISNMFILLKLLTNFQMLRLHSFSLPVMCLWLAVADPFRAQFHVSWLTWHPWTWKLVVVTFEVKHFENESSLTSAVCPWVSQMIWGDIWYLIWTPKLDSDCWSPNVAKCWKSIHPKYTMISIRIRGIKCLNFCLPWSFRIEPGRVESCRHFGG